MHKLGNRALRKSALDISIDFCATTNAIVSPAIEVMSCAYAAPDAPYRASSAKDMIATVALAVRSLRSRLPRPVTPRTGSIRKSNIDRIRASAMIVMTGATSSHPGPRTTLTIAPLWLAMNASAGQVMAETIITICSHSRRNLGRL